MKKLLFILLFLFVASPVFSTGFEITPVCFNFNGITGKGNYLIAYGNIGSALYSSDNGTNWKQTRLFEIGSVINVIFRDTSIIAANDRGQISASYDKGLTWSQKADINDSVFAFIEVPNGYLLRTKTSIKLMDTDFNIANKFSLLSKWLGPAYYFRYLRSLANFKGQLIVATDSSRFIRFDTALNLIDTISFASFGIQGIADSYYQIEMDSNYFYTKIEKIIYRTTDFLSAESFIDKTDNYKIIDNIFYIIKYNKKYLPELSDFFANLFILDSERTKINIGYFTHPAITGAINVTDFNIINNKFFLLGKNKVLFMNELSDTIFNAVSEYAGFSNLNIPPDRINDSSYLFIPGVNIGVYQNYIYLSKDNGTTLKPIIDPVKNPLFKKLTKVYFKYYDEEENKIYIGGQDRYEANGRVFITMDNDYNFTSKILPQFDFSISYNTAYRGILPRIPNIQKSGDRFIIANNQYINKIRISSIFSYDRDFNLISRHIDSNLLVDYVIAYPDTNRLLIHLFDYTDSTTQIRYTVNDCLGWKTVDKLSRSNKLISVKEIQIAGSTYFIIIYLNNQDSLLRFKAIDTETLKSEIIHCHKPVDLYLFSSLEGNAITSDDSTAYIAVADTIYYTTDIFDHSKWKYVHLPQGGMIFSSFRKFGDNFFACYGDSLHIRTSYWVKIDFSADSTTALPIISAGDVDFGKSDIKSDSVRRTVQVQNLSVSAYLKIFGIRGPFGEGFAADSPSIDSLNPIIIEPGKSYEFGVSFKPLTARQYLDSIVYISNAVDSDNVVLLTGEGIDTTSSGVEMTAEKKDYIYIFPPFPIPAVRSVRSLVYWESSIDFQKENILIFNVYGTKVGDGRDIAIDKLAPYKGYLTWNCSSYEPGVYFIRIRHGNNSACLKILVAK